MSGARSSGPRPREANDEGARPSAGSAPRSSLFPLRDPAFRALWLSATISSVGTWVQEVGQGWLMLSLTHDPVPVAMLATCFTVPTFALIIPGGLLADRLDRRSMVLWGQLFAAAVASTLALVTWSGHVAPWHILASAAALGVGVAFTTPAWQSLVPDLVSRSQLAEAITLNSVSFNIARTVGPALGGLILTLSGPPGAFAFNAITFFALIWVLWRYEHIRKVSARPRKRRQEKLGQALLAAFVETRKRRPLLVSNVSASAFALGAAAMMALLPVHAKTTLGVTSQGYGLLLGALGFGALLGALALRRFRGVLTSRQIVGGGMTLWSCAVMGLGFARSEALAMALLVPAGVGWLTSLSSLNALVQLSAPEWVKSRVVALYTLLFFLVWSIGASAGGFVAKSIGVAHTMSLAGLVAFAAALLTFALPLPKLTDEVIETPAPPGVDSIPPAAS